MNSNERRLSRVAVSMPLLTDIFSAGWRRDVECIKGLPPGAVFMWSAHEEAAGIVHLVYFHPSFPVVEPGDYIPEIAVECIEHHTAPRAYETTNT